MAASGASLTFPIRAGEVKKGTHVMIKGHPCKVIEVSDLQASMIGFD
jgi:translation initiation factor 5A